MSSTVRTVNVLLELFGQARLMTGLSEVEVALPLRSRVGDVASALAQLCPELVGDVIRGDVSGFQDSYVLNLNGLSFVEDGWLAPEPGDRLLVFSSQAGG